MLIPARRSRLQDILEQRGMSDLDSLARELQVSLSTIRRDIEQLESKGLVSRSHGAVVWKPQDESSASSPYAFDQRMQFQYEAKKQIAREAKKLVQPGDTILLDGGTTAFYLAHELVGMPLQVVTNSLPIADLFVNDERVELLLTGGLVYPRYGVLLGPMTEGFLSTIHARALFMSVAGIHDGQMFNQNLLLVQAERRMMEQAQQIVLLADSGKFGQKALAHLGALSEVDVVVSDSKLSAPSVQAIEKLGVRVHVAPD